VVIAKLLEKRVTEGALGATFLAPSECAPVCRKCRIQRRRGTGRPAALAEARHSKAARNRRSPPAAGPARRA
jgi:hypothetical protein